MNRYKVQFSHCFDVLAPNESEAIRIADGLQDNAIATHTMHYYLDSDPTIYDVTNTDDPFNP